MASLVGIDEAGYGPFLGPLTVAATVFHCPSTPLEQADTLDLWEHLGRDTVVRTRKALRKSWDRLLVCDSKLAYGGKRKLIDLEQTVWTFLATAAATSPRPTPLPTTLEALIPALGGSLGEPPPPWFAEATLPVPHKLLPGQCEHLQGRLTSALDKANAQFVGAAVRALPAQGLNHHLRTLRNKHTLEWSLVADLLQTCVHGSPPGPVSVQVDRLAGRQFYGDALTSCFPAATIEVLREEPESSSYRVLGPERTVHVHFSVKGDDLHFATALASMTAKYIREILMLVLNGFFAKHLAGLKPTAGYGKDGRRFISEVTPLLSALGISESTLVRKW